MGTTSVFIALTLILEYSLIGRILSNVRSLSIICHLLLINVPLPATVTIYYSYIFELVRFDLFEEYLGFEAALEFVFGFEDEPFNERTDELGYGSRFIISNLGSVFIFFVINVIINILYWLIIKSELFEKTNILFKFAKKQFNSFIWNGLITFLNESYLLLCFCAAINIAPNLPQYGF